MEFALFLIPFYAAIRLSGAFAESISEFVGGLFFWLFAIICTSVTAAGFLSVLDQQGVLAVLLIWFGISFLVKPRWDVFSRAVSNISRFDVVMFAVISWMLVLIIAASWHYPPTPYDAYVYHLVMPARWIQAKMIFIVPTPFGDPASAYAPANGSSFYAYLMLLAGDDRLCRAGELIFWIISVFAVYRLCELLGVSAFWRYIAVIAFSFSRDVLFQAASSEVDLIVAACGLWLFIALIRTAEKDARWLWAFGAALGLGVGTKFVAFLLYLPLLLASIFILWRREAKRLGRSLLLALFFGGAWYLRNWIETSNPFFPVQLDIFGSTLFWGPITVGGMRQSVFHIQGWDYKIASLLLLLGKNAWIFLIWPLAAGVVAACALGARWTRIAVFWALFGLAIHFELIPYNSQYRFLIIFLAILWIAAASGLSRLSRVIGYIFAAPIALGILATLFINPLNYDFALSRATSPVGGNGVFVNGAWWLIIISLAWFVSVAVRIKARFSAASLIIVSSAAWLIAWVSMQTFLPIMKLGKTAFYAGDASKFYAELWKYEQPKRIAYAGFNGFYPLFAPDRKHTPFYLNTTAGVFWKYHDYARWWRSKNLPLPPLPDKPALYRLRASKDFWLQNMMILKPDLIAVYKLSPFEVKYIEHDERGFPVEKSWLESMPNRFAPIFESGDILVYRVLP